MRPRDPYVIELAQTVNVMFGEGKFDPSADEIAEVHFPDRDLGGEIVEGIRKRLRKVRDVLEVDYQRLCHSPFSLRVSNLLILFYTMGG